MDEHQKRAFDFVVSLRDFYGDYHAKKEREAYVVAILYLGATAAFLTQKWPGREKLLFAGVIGATVLAVVLVAFQLYSRWFAARIVAASTTVASRWLADAPILEHYRPARLGPAEWPDAVVRAFREHGTVPPLLALIGVPALLFLWGAAIVISEVCA
jgi:hypothetical protein